LPPPGAGTEWRRARLKEPGALLDVSVVPWNFVSLACYRALNRAAALLLARVGEQRRISLGSARRALLSGHKDHLPKALRTGIFSEYAIIDRAIKKVSSIERADGIYVLPIVFAPLAQNTDYTLGPITLLSAKEFRARYGAPLAETKGTKLGDMLLDGWCKYAERYDHFMMVQVKGHEEDKARQTAREVGELVLNLIRMVFRFSATDNIRIGDGFVWESSRSAVYFDLENSAHLSLCKGPSNGWDPCRSYRQFSGLGRIRR
jgi:hypothetical protein